jgi:hypothetical protein
MAEQEQVTSASSGTAPRTGQPGVGWKGAQRESEVIRHRWQRDWTRHTSRTLQTRKQWRRIRIAGSLGGSLLLFGVLLYYLLFFPIRVPLLTVVVTDYTWPIPPNAWAHEDLAALQRLDQEATRTWWVRDISPSWRTRHHGLRQLDEQLAQLVPEARRAGLLVVYLSMHGAVNAEGEPCLLTRESSPLDSTTWLPLREVLQRIGTARQLPRSVRKLVILDCNRHLVDWNTGRLYNSFAERLPGLVAELGIDNLVVLNSTGPGQQAGLAPDIQGTVFGHLLQLGLAGAADMRDEGGNEDGRVSLHELLAYLERHTQRHTQEILADPQRPILVPAETGDFNVSWRLNQRTLNELLTRARQAAVADPNLAVGERQQLWRRRDELWAAQPYRFAPLAWRDFEQRLLWLEQLSESGPGYGPQAVQVARDTTRLANQLAERLAQARRQGTLPAYLRIVGNRAAELPADLPAHSLSMATFLRDVPVNVRHEAAAAWDNVVASPGAGTLPAALSTLRQGDLPGPLAEAQFLHFLRRYELLALWANTPIMARALRLRSMAQRFDAPPPLGHLPGDERAHYWVRPLLEQADRVRRQAEDRFLAGTERDAAELDELFSSSLYDRAQHDLNEIATALANRDRAWAHLAYWAQWLTRPQRDESEQQAADQRINEVLLPLVETLHSLEVELIRQESDGTFAVEVGRWSGGPVASELHEYLQTLHAWQEQQTTRFLSANPQDTGLFRDLQIWLGLPLSTWDERQALQEKRRQVADELRNASPTTLAPARRAGTTPRAENGHQRARSAASSAVAERPADRPSDPYVHRMSSAWTMHPVRAILQLDSLGELPTKSPSGSSSSPTAMRPVEHAERTGAKLRERLRMLANDEFLYRELDAAEIADRTPGTPPQTVFAGETQWSWRACCRAESLVRAGSGFWFPDPSADPVARLRQRDLQQLLLWNAHRVLEDSWGAAGQAGRPFFAEVAESYLRGAERIVPANPAVQRQWNALSDRVKRRREQLEQAVSVTASDLLLADPGVAATTRMEVRRGSSLPPDTDVFPAGSWISFLSDARGRLPDTSRVVPAAQITAEAELLAEWEFMLPGELLTDRGPQLEALTTFRGNEFRAPLLVRLVEGRRVVTDLVPPGPSEITLFGVPRRRASVQFILDCSQSMSEPEAVESPSRGVVSQQPRMEVARAALETLLRQLAAEQEHRVGVHFFGHRVGWSVVEQGRLLQQLRYIGEIPEGLQPYEDVEVVLPLGRFDEAALTRVTRSLRSVEPWGETPLYLSIIGALRDFEMEESDAEQIVVVITDGLNYQFNPPREAAKVSLDVLEAATRSRASIHIIGFGIPAAEQEEALREFSAIADATGGSYVVASNASLLFRTMQDLLRPSQFRLQFESGAWLDEAEVGMPIRISPQPPLPQAFTVTYESLTMPLELRGGERVALQVSADRSRLEILKVGNERLPQLELLQAPGGERVGVRAMAHRPVRQEDGVRFSISFQRDDRQFLTRPADVWAEIRPLFAPHASPDTSSRQEYQFYDTVFAADQPAPMLQWFAESWPAGAERAEIRLWIRPRQGPAAEDAVSLQAIADQVPRRGTGFTRDAVPGISFQARTLLTSDPVLPLRVVVVERHHGPTSEVGDWRLDLLPPPRRVERRLDTEQHIALHTFYYEGSDPTALRQHELRFVSRDRFRADSWYLADPLQVEIANRVDLLPLAPARGN